MSKFEVPVNYLRSSYERDDRLAIVRIQRSTGSVKQEFRTANELRVYKGLCKRGSQEDEDRRTE